MSDSGSKTSLVGERVGNYQILARVGAGGMGVVYKARDLTLDRIVALKFLPEEVAASERERERFLREAKAASSLDHPNIGVIHGVEQATDGRMYIVMAYYEGETLALRILRGLVPPPEAVNIAIQVARGLNEAHSHGIIHRDIKPSNIILARQNVVKIVDFGLARVASSPSITQTAATVGTFAYMSPEQAQGGALDQRTDIWSLGVIMVEMLTGVNPFHHETPSATLIAILNQPPANMDKVPVELLKITYAALSKDTGHRYQSCAPMLTDLNGAQAQVGSFEPKSGEHTTGSSITSKELRPYVVHASSSVWQAAQPKKTNWPKWIVGGVAGFVLLAVLALAPWIRERLGGKAPSGREKHIAVLPFDNIGNDPTNALLAEGLMDSLSSRLSNLDSSNQSLWVVPASVVRAQNVQDPSAALKDLGATLVVKGSIERSGQDVRLTLNLIDTQNLRQIASIPLEDRAGDLATLQDEAVGRLAHLMNLEVTTANLRGGNVAPAAYESYLKALGYIQRYDKPGNLDLAITALQSAVQTDPAFALGYAELGEAYRLKNQLDPNPKWIAEVSANCQKAIQLDNRLPAGYVTLGRLHSALGKNDLALQEFQSALQINPRDPDATVGLASVYEHMGRTADAEANYRRGAALRPDYWDGYNSLGWFFYRQGRTADAITQFRRVVELTPDNAAGYSNLAAALVDLGDPKSLDEAEAALKKSIQLAPSYAAYANLGNLYLKLKRYPESVEMTRKALAINDKDYYVWDNLLIAYQSLHDEQNVTAVRQKVLATLEPYVASHAQDAQAAARLGTLEASSGNREKALRYTDAALTVAPKDAYVLAEAAETYDRLGDRKKALEYAHQSMHNGYTLADLQGRPGMQDLAADPTLSDDSKK
jgi:eukaryotic-like serine/threonine-protein kinase